MGVKACKCLPVLTMAPVFSAGAGGRHNPRGTSEFYDLGVDSSLFQHPFWTCPLSTRKSQPPLGRPPSRTERRKQLGTGCSLTQRCHMILRSPNGKLSALCHVNGKVTYDRNHQAGTPRLQYPAWAWDLQGEPLCPR